jgi:antitoxin CptB
LLEVQDQDLFAWVTGEQPVPPELDMPAFRKLVAFHSGSPKQGPS